VSVVSFRVFVAAVNGAHAEITSENFCDLGLLCAEFGLTELSDQIASYRSQHSSIDFDARDTLALLRDTIAEQQRAIDLLYRDTEAQAGG
jgi:hypothetical protein